MGLMATWLPSLRSWRLFLHHKLDPTVNFTAAKSYQDVAFHSGTRRTSAVNLR